jgi:hypothetical protein
MLTAFALAAAACGPTAADEQLDGGGYSGDAHGPTGATGPTGPVDQPPPDPCSDAAKLIYVVDEDMRFSSFDPRPATPVFTDLGTLSCPAPYGETPFSMSVDRSAIAWVLYSSGDLFRVDPATMSCTATAFQPGQQGLDLFGMGFASNSEGSNDETLFIAGGVGPGLGVGATLATIAFPGLGVSTVGTVSGWPELTGTGKATLWGFYPDTTPPIVAQIDKTSGAELTTFPLGSLQGTPEAWAFAFWGGDFWVFLKRDVDNDTTVYRVNGTTGSMAPAVQNTGRKIVGAGVSTCAPVIIG